jgi:hypothetical protein
MKKLLLICLLASLVACSKTNQSLTATVEYTFTANNSGTYQITYRDGNNDPVNITFTGTSWSKTVTATPANGFKYAEFAMAITTPLPNVTGIAKILVNGRSQNEDDFEFDNSTQQTSFFFNDLVFSNNQLTVH